MRIVAFARMDSNNIERHFCSPYFKIGFYTTAGLYTSELVDGVRMYTFTENLKVSDIVNNFETQGFFNKTEFYYSLLKFLGIFVLALADIAVSGLLRKNFRNLESVFDPYDPHKELTDYKISDTNEEGYSLDILEEYVDEDSPTDPNIEKL